MSKERAKKTIEVAVEAAAAISFPIAGEISLHEDEVSKPKYTIVRNVSMTQFGGTTVKTSGVLDETKTLLATAIARPGDATYNNGASNSLVRTTMYGDVAIFTFNNEKNIVGVQIMPSKAWMIMQVKSAQGEERPPYIRTPWDVKQSIVSKTGSLQPPSFDPKIKELADAAINLAATECLKRISENKPSSIQEDYTPAIRAAAEIANTLSSRRSQNTQSNSMPTDAVMLGKNAASLL